MLILLIVRKTDASAYFPAVVALSVLLTNVSIVQSLETY